MGKNDKDKKAPAEELNGNNLDSHLSQFVAMRGPQPDWRDRSKRARWFDDFEDFGGLLDIEGDSELSEAVDYFEKFSLGKCIAWENVNAAEVHGHKWLYVPVADKSIPLPRRHALGHAVARMQIRAAGMNDVDIENVHPFAKGVIG